MRDAMHGPVVSATSETTLWAAMDKMIATHLHHVGVVDGDRALGLISDRDLAAVWALDPLGLKQHTAGHALAGTETTFGNLGPDSGSGVAFTRDPGSGRSGVYGDYLPDAQGEDVVSGVRDALALDELERLDPDSYTRLRAHLRRLEAHYRDLCDVEFTIERGRLWVLHADQGGQRTPEAAFRIVCALVCFWVPVAGWSRT